MRRILLFSMVSALILGQLPVEADDVPWTYTSETHVITAPATAEGMMYGLDARPRGLDDTESTTVDPWFWTIDWEIGLVSFKPCATFLIFK